MRKSRPCSPNAASRSARRTRATERFSATLRGTGFTVEERGNLSPVVYATIPVSRLSAYAERADVQRVYLAENRNEDYMNVAAPSIQANWVWFAGFSGADANIAIVEDSRVDFDNNCLVNNLGTRVADHANVDTHATATAGMAASNNSTHRGIAYGAGIYSANGTDYTDANMSAALDAAVTNADILNNSWGPDCGGADGSMNVHARHADYIVRRRRGRRQRTLLACHRRQQRLHVALRDPFIFRCQRLHHD